MKCARRSPFRTAHGDQPLDLGGVMAGHPTNKADYRPAALPPRPARCVCEGPSPSGPAPLFRAAQREGAQNGDHVRSRRRIDASSGELQGFAIAGADQKFVWAQAEIADGKVIVWSDEVREPRRRALRMAANPNGNLVNAARLPASPFRTDDWK